MSLFRKISGKEKHQERERELAELHEAYQEALESCPHVALAPRWDSVEDMGKPDKATSYYCQACNRTLTPDEARPYLG